VSEPIDRERLVRRHNPVLTAPHPTDVLTVGNGDIAMTVDLTGLQTFPEFHELQPDPDRIPHDGSTGLPEREPRPFSRDDFQIPLRTQSTWGWYSTRSNLPHRPEDAETVYETDRGPVPYLDRMGLLRAGDPVPEKLAAGAWLAYNPRRAHLGRLALDVLRGGPALESPEQLTAQRTELDLWSGAVEARFQLDGTPVEVTTVADPSAHRFSTRVVSPLLARGLAVSWIFDPQPDDLAWFENRIEESTTWHELAPGHWRARRQLEADGYEVDVVTNGILDIRYDGTRLHATAPGRDALEVTVTLHPATGSVAEEPSDFCGVRERAASWWKDFWMSGAAIDFDGSADPRAHELERRIVLSQYLTAVNSAGAAPPAETGLTYNTWTGKFHLEMHWWHAAHFPLWGRGALLERSLDWYHQALGAAQATARRQGYQGARWPKQTDLSAQESPSHIGVFLIWQQPHIIHLLELLYRESRDTAFLERHYPLIEATADFMADFAEEDADGRFRLPPPLIPAQESYLTCHGTNADPTFELAYWSWALSIACRWRERLGMPVPETWRRVSEQMHHPARMPDGSYAALATPPHLIRKDHPSHLMALGWLPDTTLIDPDTMAATLRSVREDWDLSTTWGWDYPVMAMTAARLGDLGAAVDALLMSSPKNVFLPNGHNPQMRGFLTLYLPANGGLLAAIAHLAAAIDRGAVLPEGWRMRREGFAHRPAEGAGPTMPAERACA